MTKEVYRVEDFDRKNIGSLFSNLKDGELLSVWSPIEVRLLAEISPVTVKRINESTGFKYEISSKNLEEQAKTLAGFLMLSIDNSIFKGTMQSTMVKSKVRNLEILYEAIGEECPISKEDVTDDNFIDFAYVTKKLALSIAKRYQRDFAETHRLEPQNHLRFVSFFADLFGNNLERVIQYGSSVKGDGKEKDIDLMLLLNKINRRTYDLIKGKREYVPSEKPVGIVLLPSDGLSAYTECNYHCLTIAREGRLVYGEAIDFPVLSEEDSIRKMYFKAGKELTSLRNALGDKNRQEALAQRPEFLRDTLKLEIWIRKALLQQELGKYLSKDEFLELEPVPIIDLGNSPSISEVRSALYDANCRVKKRIEQYFSVKTGN